MKIQSQSRSIPSSPYRKLGAKLTNPFLGKIACAIDHCLGKRTPLGIAVYAELARQKGGSAPEKNTVWQERIQKGIEILPYVGIVVGLVLGIMNKEDLFASSRTDCQNGFANHPFLQGVNRVKQWEIKHFAYLTSFLLPACIHVREHFSRVEWGGFKDHLVELFLAIPSKKNKGAFSGKFCVKSVEALFRAFADRVVYTTSLLVLGLGNPIYTLILRTCFRGFDPSGHFLLKSISASLLSAELSLISKKISNLAKLALLSYSAMIAATDAVLLYNTASRCHTIPEVFSGLLLGVGCVGLSRYFEKRVALSNPIERS